MTDQAPITCINGHEYFNKFWGECPHCQGQRNARTHERTADSIRRLKAAMEAGNEKEAYREAQQLRELGHPDVDGLCLTVRTRLERQASKSGGRTTSAPKWSKPDWLKE